MITTPRRLGALALLASIALAACSSSGASTAPSAAARRRHRPRRPARPRAARRGSAAPSAAAGPVAADRPRSRSRAPAPPSRRRSTRAGSRPTTASTPNIQIDYQANGSGAGITAITQQTVDFGASDAAMKDTEIAALPAGQEALPLPDRARRGRRDLQPAGRAPSSSSTPPTSPASSSARSRSGTTRRSPRTTPGVTLPDTAILVVHRSDGSGTTNAFTTYLDTVDPTWHTERRRGQGGQVADRHRRPGQ